MILQAIALTLSAVLAVPVPGTAVAPRPVPADFFGMHAISVPPSHLRGVASVRLWDTDTTWRVLNPRRGVYHWRTLDARVRAAARAGVRVLLVLGTTPAWAGLSQDPKDAHWLGPGSASPPRRMADWEAFVSAAARRYKGRIEAYQVWNEPTDRIFWRGSLDTLAQMTRVAHDAVAAADPNAIVVAAPIIIRGPQWRTDARDYLRALEQQGWPVDVLAFHGYAPGSPGPSARKDAIRRVLSVISRSGAPDLPLWETEVNYPYEQGAPRGVGTATERSWLARTYLDAARLGVERVYWYAYADVPDFLAVDIRRPAVSPAFEAVSSWMTGASIVACTDDWQSLSGVTGCAFVDAEGRTAVALWSPVPQFVRPGRGRVTDLNGTSWPVSSTLLVTASPIWFMPSDRAS